MTHRLASAFAVVLLAASPALAQMEPSRELELGGGWFQDNPLDVDDIGVVPSGPSVDLAWTTWRNERTGIAIGVTSILGRDASRWRKQEVGIYGHVTWRWRWVNADGRGFLHFGVGAGPLLGRESTPVVSWDPERQTWCYTGETKHRLGLAFILWHVELMATRTLRDGLDVRVGVSTTPLLYVPITAHPVVMAVWRF